MKTEDLEPGDRILIWGEAFPKDEIEVLQPIGALKSVVEGVLLVRYVQRSVVFVLEPGVRFNKIEGLP